MKIKSFNRAIRIAALGFTLSAACGAATQAWAGHSAEQKKEDAGDNAQQGQAAQHDQSAQQGQAAQQAQQGQSAQQGEIRYCSSYYHDVKKNGWGWENGDHCKIHEENYPYCKNNWDEDGDGFGWEHSQACRLW